MVRLKLKRGFVLQVNRLKVALHVQWQVLCIGGTEPTKSGHSNKLLPLYNKYKFYALKTKAQKKLPRYSNMNINSETKGSEPI